MNDPVRQLACGGALEDKRAPAALHLREAALKRALVVLPLTSAVFAVSALWSPSDLPAVVLCPFRALTGLPCPGCGMTRAFCALGHGDLSGAFGYNALATVLKFDSARAALERLKPTPRAAGFMLAVTLVWWVVRLSAGL